MLISPRQFPHPVLSFFSDDFIDCEYQCAVKTSTTGTTFNFDVVAITSSKDLNHLLSNGKACHAIHVDCSSTRYREAFKSNMKKFSFHVDSKYINGRVQVSRFIVAEQDIPEYSNTNFHGDYNGVSFNIKKGDILALNETFTFDADKEIDPLKSIPSIFSVRVNKVENPPPIDIELSNKINVYLSESNYRKFKMLNQIQSLRPVVSQFILIPALVMVLDTLKNSQSIDLLQLEDLRWYRVLQKKLVEYGVDISDGTWPESSVILSQKLIGEPITKSLEAIEVLMMEA